MKVIAVVSGGIGNLIQMTAAVRTIRIRKGWDVDIFYQGLIAESGEHKEVDQICAVTVYNAGNLPRPLRYGGAVLLGFGAINAKLTWRGLPILNDIVAQQQVASCRESEVAISMKACEDLGVATEELIYQGELRHVPTPDHPKEIVIANGYCRRPGGYWDVKGFPGFETLVREIRVAHPHLSICSIGRTQDEFVLGTGNRTGYPLLFALGLIKGAKLLICTDSMAFHAAGVFNTPTVALFTATSVVKNADPRFHASATIVGREDLPCRPNCQPAAQAWRNCPEHLCQEIGIGLIMSSIKERLGEKG